MKDLRRNPTFTPESSFQKVPLKKIRGGLLFAIGWLLSPLCWWNDLIFNLPVAYGFGYLWGRVSSDWVLPGTISGYWLSNLVGILLMQAGAIDVFQSQERDLKKELVWGVISSSIFTIGVVVLIQLKILDFPIADSVGGQ